MTIEMNELNPIERYRVYEFANEQFIYLENVTHIKVSDSGTHRLKTQDGKLHIISVGWLHIEIDADDWSL